ncbi:hypothetical protein [Flavihumibacter profundi]|jgi:hypothetical protein|uniref:hypothetical protein n=1 Tax=Flavihumibacter profundi TaxID=2716883 RepID=UPI001CC35415|nr:hypothetical protein [Flavihumibacter profundi]MBZ5856400.1 hypothetical protein [Flavihumibacter profundi]
MFKNLVEVGGNLADYGEKISQIGGHDKTANILGRMGTGFTLTGIGLNIADGNYIDAGIGALSLTKLNPYVFVFQTAQAVLTSDFTLNQAAFEANQTMTSYLMAGSAARANGDNELANSYFNEAAKYEAIRNNLLNMKLAK